MPSEQEKRLAALESRRKRSMASESALTEAEVERRYLTRPALYDVLTLAGEDRARRRLAAEHGSPKLAWEAWHRVAPEDRRAAVAAEVGELVPLVGTLGLLPGLRTWFDAAGAIAVMHEEDSDDKRWRLEFVYAYDAERRRLGRDRAGNPAWRAEFPAWSPGMALEDEARFEWGLLGRLREIFTTTA